MSDTTFNEAAADRIVKWAQAYCIVPELGSLYQMPEWLRVPLRKVFGTMKADGYRQARTLYLEVPKKNTKSLIGSIIALYMLCADGEQSGEVYSVAGSRAQASIIFETAKKMVELSPKLSKIIKPYRYSLIHPKSGSVYRVLASDATTLDGIKPSCILFDELHEQPDRRLWDVLRGGSIARRQPLTVVTTTAGHDRSSIAWEIHDYACRVRDGKLDDPSFIPVVYGADESDDISDPIVWHKANPNLGISIPVDEFRRLYLEAVAAGPARLNSWKRYHLNLWTQLSSAFIPMAAWNECGREKLDLDDLQKRPAYPALDLSQSTDLTALTLAFPREDGSTAILVWHWMPAATIIEAELRDKQPYRAWTEQGYSETHQFLETCPGSAIDYEMILRRIVEISQVYKFANNEIAFDESWSWQFGQSLEAKGFSVVAFDQSAKGMNAPMRETYRLIDERKLVHGHNPLLNFEASVIEAREFDGLLRPWKGKGALRKRIDGMVTTFAAIGRAIVGTHTAPIAPSVYETSGVFIL